MSTSNFAYAFLQDIPAVYHPFISCIDSYIASSGAVDDIWALRLELDGSAIISSFEERIASGTAQDNERRRFLAIISLVDTNYCPMYKEIEFPCTRYSAGN